MGLPPGLDRACTGGALQERRRGMGLAHKGPNRARGGSFDRANERAPDEARGASWVMVGLPPGSGLVGFAAGGWGGSLLAPPGAMPPVPSPGAALSRGALALPWDAEAGGVCRAERP